MAGALLYDRALCEAIGLLGADVVRTRACERTAVVLVGVKKEERRIGSFHLKEERHG